MIRMNHHPADYRAIVRQMALDEATFIQLTLRGKIQGGEAASIPWRQITVRPVQIKNRRHLQFSYLDDRKDITKNFAGGEAERALDEALAIPFSAIHVRTTDQALQVQITKKGRAILHYSQPNTPAPVDLAHDAAKPLPLPAGKPDTYLQAAGIMNATGQIRPGMRAKFVQVNEFIKLLEHTGGLEGADPPLRVVDFGCGSAYLTLGLYHYLNHVRGIPALLDGVDHNAALIDKGQAAAQQLGYEGVRFHAAAIGDFTFDRTPDIVTALHACDTATDDALAQGIRSGAGVILAAPCCHHDLHTQLSAAVDPFRPVLRQGILRQRMGDILTDTFRALLLRLHGYKTDVVEFIAPEHTDRNLMIRAVKIDGPDPDREMFRREYEELKAFWNVTPYLERLLER
jgi:SAM-dependent methyltransferase